MVGPASSQTARAIGPSTIERSKALPARAAARASTTSPGLPGGRERSERPRRPDAAGLDLLEVRDPRLAAVGGAVGGPREAIRLDVVIADAPLGRLARGHAERLLDVHFRADALPGAHVLQAAPRVGADQLPALAGAVVVAQRRRDVIRLSAVADDAILVQDLSLREAHGAPVPAHRSVLP